MTRQFHWSLVFLCLTFQPAFTQEKSAPQKKADDGDKKSEAETGEKGKEKNEDPLKEVLAGHSYHGDAFNEGPRQSAYLMKGTGKVRFPVTSSHPEVQKFIEQGIGQLHGFWDLEAERSFRHAASLDPDCAMAYWGAALATKRNSKRSRGFMDEAVQRKSKASAREQKYIDALNAYIPKTEKKKEGEDKRSEKEKREAERKKREKDRDSRKKRAENYTKALESIALEFPEDIEAKALLALQLYDNRRAGLPILSYLRFKTG